MKTLKILFSMLCGLMGLTSSQAMAQNATHVMTAQHRVSTTGSYEHNSPSDPEIIQAAAFAVKSKILMIKRKQDPLILKEIVSAKSQVVGGYNYDMMIKVWERKILRTAQVRVHKNLTNDMQLISWTWLAD